MAVRKNVKLLKYEHEHHFKARDLDIPLIY